MATITEFKSHKSKRDEQIFNTRRAVTPNVFAKSGEARTIIDLTHFIQFMMRSNHVSGIQRVIQAIIEHAQDYDHVIFSIRSRGEFWQLERSAGLSLNDTIHAYIAWKKISALYSESTHVSKTAFDRSRT